MTGLLIFSFRKVGKVLHWRCDIACALPADSLSLPGYAYCRVSNIEIE